MEVGLSSAGDFHPFGKDSLTLIPLAEILKFPNAIPESDVIQQLPGIACTIAGIEPVPFRSHGPTRLRSPGWILHQEQQRGFTRAGAFRRAFAVSDGRIGHRSGREGGGVAGDVSKARSISASPTPHPPTGRRGPGESRLSLSVRSRWAIWPGPGATRWPWPSTGCGPFRSRPERSGFRTTA